MDKIGTSHIATADLLICGIAIILIRWLWFSPVNHTLSRVIALLSGCTIVAVVIVLVFVDLNRDAVWELSMIALWLCISLWKWNDVRSQTRRLPSS